jgi:hypothetical protein
MTNLIASVLVTLTTNWATVSTTTPVCDRPGCAVLHYSMENQVGEVSSNTVVKFSWQGTEHEVVVESVLVKGDANLRRSIPSGVYPLWRFYP